MTSVYLDTNAASYLFERRGWSVDRLSALRRTLARACDSGRVALVTSMGLAEELVGIRRIDRARFVRTVKFVYDLAGWRILLPLPKRMEGEVVARTKLSGRAPFLRSAMRKRFRQSLMNPDFTQEVDSAVRSEMAAFLASQTARRKEVRTKLGPKWAAHTRGWWREAVPLVDLWTYNDLRASRDAVPTDTLLSR